MLFALLDEHLPDHCVFEHKEKKMVHSMFREVLEGKQSSTGGDRGKKKTGESSCECNPTGAIPPAQGCRTPVMVRLKGRQVGTFQTFGGWLI